MKYRFEGANTDGGSNPIVSPELPDLEVDMLLRIEDVTQKVKAATGAQASATEANRARKAREVAATGRSLRRRHIRLAPTDTDRGVGIRIDGSVRRARD